MRPPGNPPERSVPVETHSARARYVPGFRVPGCGLPYRPSCRSNGRPESRRGCSRLAAASRARRGYPPGEPARSTSGSCPGFRRSAACPRRCPSVARRTGRPGGEPAAIADRRAISLAAISPGATPAVRPAPTGPGNSPTLLPDPSAQPLVATGRRPGSRPACEDHRRRSQDAHDGKGQSFQFLFCGGRNWAAEKTLFRRKKEI
jgi:hypothetical protein